MDLVAVKKEHDGQQYDADQDIGLTDRDMKLIGNTDPEKTVNEEDIEKQRQLLNRCLSDSPRGRIIGQEKNFYLLNIGEHQVVMQYIVYHVGFARRPVWLED